MFLARPVSYCKKLNRIDLFGFRFLWFSHSSKYGGETSKSSASAFSLPDHLRNLDIPNDPIFSIENIKDLPREEVEKLIKVYRMIEGHATALEEGNHVKTVDNPLLDQVPLRNFPSLSPPVVETFRKHFPAEKIEHLVPQRGSSLKPSETPSDAGQEQAYQRMDRFMSQTQQAKDDAESGVPRGYNMVGRYRQKRKVCPLTSPDGTVDIDFRNVEVLKHFVSESGKILPRYKTGLSKVAQYRVARAITIAREMALLHPTMSLDLALQERRKRRERAQAPE
ncbi:hypothetical protein Gasu2_37740 [Galdieria sulphuraria]|uniref:30S ribosomal protein S18 family n=1 Tax=Galdieria sulphuraria TaxID=130081 RepID=M2XUS0_GALSU|nr:30S ribosomal protein S18 family [Galdieria sulphuraria]EME27373.1 30S ribosomal protein S18 family [Galdieria sulphuraria]GJD09527.1 hypothetical protein Gasu2_37740 [Galdieria sulphuraria]|eukprot:XP_005703893.1 30S ribosomal protein S18 family [Galdieria sulphuraria]